MASNKLQESDVCKCFYEEGETVLAVAAAESFGRDPDRAKGSFVRWSNDIP